MHPSSAAGRVGNPAGQELAELLPAARSRPLSTRPARPAPGPVRPAAGPVRPAAGPVRPATSAAAQPLGRPAPRTPAVHQPQGPACGGSRSHGPRKPVDHSRNIKATRRGPEWLQARCENLVIQRDGSGGNQPDLVTIQVPAAVRLATVGRLPQARCPAGLVNPCRGSPGWSGSAATGWTP